MNFVIKLLLLVGVAYLLYSPINEQVEDRWMVLPLSPIFKVQHLVSDTLLYAGFRNIHFLDRVALAVHTWLNSFKPVNGDVDIEEHWFDGIRVKVHIPHGLKDVPVGHRSAAIYYHGGGYCLGTPEQYVYILNEIAIRSNILVVAIAYRLAPEHIYPTSIEDSFTATTYFLEHCRQRWGVDPLNVFTVGDSAGGHLAAKMTLRLQNEQSIKIKAVALIYPSLQGLSTNTPSYQENRNDFILPVDRVIKFRLSFFHGQPQEHYKAMLANNHTTHAIRKKFADDFDLPELATRGPAWLDGGGDPKTVEAFKSLYERPYSTPLFADLSQFPPTLLISCRFDVLHDDSVMMARRLRKENVKVIHETFNSFHGMFSLAPSYKPANRALDDLVTFIQENMEITID